MKRMWITWPSLILLAIYNIIPTEAIPSYVVTIPPVLRPGENLVIHVDLFNTNSSVNVKVELRAGKSAILEKLETIQAGKMVSKDISLKIPYDRNMARFNVLVSGSGGISFNAYGPVQFSQSVMIFIQTDRAMYAENENVKSRILVFRPDLRPFLGALTLEAYNGENKLVRQWKDVSPAQGVYEKEFNIGVEPSTGTWKLIAIVKGLSVEKTFVVRKYVLPKFTVNIECTPSVITSITKSISCTVDSRYTTNEYVTGMIRYQALKKENVFLENGYDDIIGRKTFTVQLANKSIDTDIDVIAQVGDASTGTTVTNEVKVKYQGDKPLSWNLEPRRDTFMPGLSFPTSLKFEPIPHKNVRLAVTTTKKERRTCTLSRRPYDYMHATSTTRNYNLQVDGNGYGKITLNPNTDASEITFTIYDGTSSRSVILTAGKGSGQYIFIDPITTFMNVGAAFSFNVVSNKVLNGDLIYEVYSRGRRVSRGELKATLTTRQKITIDTVIPDFYPSAVVLVYLSMPNGEVAMDRAEFETRGNCLNNYATLSTHESDAKPGDNVTIEVGAKANSTVYLMGVDLSVTALQTGFDVVMSDVIDSLQSENNIEIKDIGFYSNSEQSDKELPSVCDATYRTSTGGRSDQISEPKSNEVVNKTTRLQPIERAWFPKTWLWERVFVGETNITTIQRKVPDTVTTWRTSAFSVHNTYGLGLLNPAHKTRVFKDFFIEVTLPEYAYEGSVLVCTVTIFNYRDVGFVTQISFWYGGIPSFQSIWVEKRTSEVISIGMTVRIEEYGEQIIQFVARNPADYQTTLDIVNKTLIVKPPGITNDYNIPSLISLTNEEVNKEMNLTLPDDAIAGTKQVYATVTGNIMAPTINGLDNLIRPPYGCGEQNMVTFAPTVYVLQYLIITNQFTYSLMNKGHEMINRGMAKQLEFRRPDEGSFAIWGAYSEKGSTWLTSFVLRTFHHANKFAAANVDLNIIQEAITWLVNQQQSDGSFNVDDTVENYVMMGGVRDSKVTMTSYVLLSLLDNQNVVGCEEIVKEAIKNSVNYIVSNKDSLSKNQFGLAIAAYALVKCNRTEEANELYQLLVKGSVKEGGMLRWNEKCNSLCDSIEASWKSPNPRAQPIEIETASYALLYLSETGKIEDGMKITKWLTSQRNPTGGYSTSQDTVVSIEALSKFSVLVDSGVYNTDLEISFSGQKGSVKINNQNTFLLQKIKLPNDTNSLNYTVKGSGMALIDVVVKYNVHAENMDTAFNINTTVEGATQTFDRISVQTCVSRKQRADKRMVVVEVYLPSGFEGNQDFNKGGVRGLKYVEPESDHVNFYFDSLDLKDTCFWMTATRIDKVTQSQKIPVIVYDYYHPVNQGRTSYTSGRLDDMKSLCEACKLCRICQSRLVG